MVFNSLQIVNWSLIFIGYIWSTYITSLANKMWAFWRKNIFKKGCMDSNVYKYICKYHFIPSVCNLIMSLIDSDLARERGVLPLLSSIFTAEAPAFNSSLTVSLSPFSDACKYRNTHTIWHHVTHGAQIILSQLCALLWLNILLMKNKHFTLKRFTYVLQYVCFYWPIFKLLRYEEK